MSWALRLALVAVTFTAASATCLSSEWKQFRGTCYWRSNFTDLWADADRACPALFAGSELASIHDLELDAFIAEEVLQGEAAWLGLSRETFEDPWLWTDGSVYNYSHWYGGDPRCLSIYDCCASINFLNDGDWTGWDCYDHYSYSFVCQLDAS